MTNYKTIERTNEAMMRCAEAGLDRIKEATRAVEAIAKGEDPAKVITGERIYDGDFGKINFGGLIEHVENTLGLLWEYRQDINTLEGQGQTK